MMRIYLDNCCFGRPFDDQSFPRIAEVKSHTSNYVNVGLSEIVMAKAEKFIRNHPEDSYSNQTFSSSIK